MKVDFIVDKLMCIDGLFQRIKPKSIETYVEIQSIFAESKVSQNLTFQDKYCPFYGLSRFMDAETQKLYFEILDEYRTKEFDFERILNQLHDVSGRVEFSFTTKMCHTLHTEMPIYDNNVAFLFGFAVHQKADKDTKIQRYLMFYNELTNIYQDLLEHTNIKNMLIQFDDEFKNPIMSQTKKLDFILWAAGK
jgi:hypothetical protein